MVFLNDWNRHILISKLILFLIGVLGQEYLPVFLLSIGDEHRTSQSHSVLIFLLLNLLIDLLKQSSWLVSFITIPIKWWFAVISRWIVFDQQSISLFDYKFYIFLLLLIFEVLVLDDLGHV